MVIRVKIRVNSDSSKILRGRLMRVLAGGDAYRRPGLSGLLAGGRGEMAGPLSIGAKRPGWRIADCRL